MANISLRGCLGCGVVIRPIRAEDEPLMIKFHGMLSDRSVYLRYFSSLSLATRTAHQRLIHICFPDPESETVLVAEHTDSDTGERSIVAVGRLNQLPESEAAELAVLVADEYQGLGLGTELSQRLIEAARTLKLKRIVAEMLGDNTAMQALLKRMGFRLQMLGDPHSVRAVLEL